MSNALERKRQRKQRKRERKAAFWNFVFNKIIVMLKIYGCLVMIVWIGGSALLATDWLSYETAKAFENFQLLFMSIGGFPLMWALLLFGPFISALFYVL